MQTNAISIDPQATGTAGITAGFLGWTLKEADLQKEDSCLSFDLEVGPILRQSQNKTKQKPKGHGIIVKADSKEDGSILGREPSHFPQL